MTPKKTRAPSTSAAARKISRVRSENILRGSNDGFVTLDFGGRITSVNEAASRILGQPAEELIGTKNWPQFTRQGAEKLEKACRRALTGQAMVEFDETFRPDDRWFSVRAYPVPFGEVAVCFRSITERKRAEASSGRLQRALEARVDDLRRVLEATSRARDVAEETCRAKDDFLHALSHELRTPLNPVLLLASEAAGNAELREEVREDFRTIAKHIAAEARLIDDLLDQMRLSRGKLALAMGPVDLHAILREAIAATQSELDQKRIAAALDLGAEQHTVNGDAMRLRQVFWNVLQNALQSAGDGGRIGVETRAGTEKEMLTVTITARGIDLASAENAGSRRSGGLGLTLARTVVELHAGRLRSVSSGRGAALVIELPLLVPEKAAPSPAAPVLPAAEADRLEVASLRSRILLVEDHEPTRMALAQLLIRRRYRVATAGSVAEATALAERKQFDLVVSDIGLPDADGYQLMATLRALHGLKGIAITGYGMQQDIVRSKTAGFVAHLIKPISAETLENALNAAAAS